MAYQPYQPPPVTYGNGPYGQPNQPSGSTDQSTQPKKKSSAQIPNWAFWTVVALAILFGIFAAYCYYSLQICRQAVFHPTCPTVLPQTCYKQGLSPCVSACNSNADCPAATPNCNNNQCTT